MKTKMKKLFVADDGKEFEDLKEAQEYNDKLYFKNPIHLTDDEIIGLLKIIYAIWFNNWDLENIKLSIGDEREFGNGFAYKLKVKTVDDEPVEYEGTVAGDNDVRLSGDTACLVYNGFSVKKVYEYLQSIKYFDRCETIPTPNPNIITDGDYIEIYEGGNEYKKD